MRSPLRPPPRPARGLTAPLRAHRDSNLVENWKIDVAAELHTFASELSEISISFDGGKTNLNFAQAALLIQGSTCVYGRKVEYLHSLVRRTLDLIRMRKVRSPARGRCPPAAPS